MAGAFSSAFSTAFDIGAGSAFKSYFVSIQEISEMLKNIASQKIGAQLVSATDGSAFTGAVTVSVTGDAGTQATGSVGSGACTHEGNGYHTYAPAQAETNYDLIGFTFTGSGAVPVTVQVRTWPTDGLASTTNITAGTLTTVTTATNVTTVNGLAANVITADSLATDAVNEIQSGLATAANLATVAGYLDTEIAAILADTNELQTDWADGGRLDLILDARASQTSLNTLDDYVDTEVAAIKAKTDQFVFTVANQVDANALTGGGGATAAAVADAVWDEILSGHAAAGSTGEALAAAGSAGDPWITAIPGAYAAGTAGYIVGTRIPNKTDLITSQSATMQTSPVRTLYITRGDSYSGATALTVAVTTNYTGYTPTFTIRHRVTDAVLCTATPVVTSSTVLTITLTTTNTAFADLLSDDEFGPHPWDIQLVSGSVQKTESGIAIVSKDQTRA